MGRFSNYYYFLSIIDKSASDGESHIPDMLADCSTQSFLVRFSFHYKLSHRAFYAGIKTHYTYLFLEHGY